MKPQHSSKATAPAALSAGFAVCPDLDHITLWAAWLKLPPRYPSGAGSISKAEVHATFTTKKTNVPVLLYESRPQSRDAALADNDFWCRDTIRDPSAGGSQVSSHFPAPIVTNPVHPPPSQCTRYTLSIMSSTNSRALPRNECYHLDSNERELGTSCTQVPFISAYIQLWSTCS